LLREFGAHSRALSADEPWRLVTAIFLHAGLLHLGFNLLAIATIGPRIEALYGRPTMLTAFVVTGALASAGSDLMGLTGVGIGASGGVMGMIGAAAGHGQRVGTSGGRALRNDMLKWALYTIVFGFWLGADNWAHAFGILTGAVFGYAVPPRPWLRPRLAAVRVLVNLVGAAGAIGAVAIILTRTPAPLPARAAPLLGHALRDDGERDPGAAAPHGDVDRPTGRGLRDDPRQRAVIDLAIAPREHDVADPEPGRGGG
jgi:membrane associated rhomboid family serine protease